MRYSRVMRAIRELGHEIAALVKDYPDRPSAYDILRGRSASATIPSLSRVIRAFRELAAWWLDHPGENSVVDAAIRSIGFGPGEFPVENALVKSVAEIPGENSSAALRRARVVATLHSHRQWMPGITRALMTVSAGPGSEDAVREILVQLGEMMTPFKLVIHDDPYQELAESDRTNLDRWTRVKVQRSSR